MSAVSLKNRLHSLRIKSSKILGNSLILLSQHTKNIFELFFQHVKSLSKNKDIKIHSLLLSKHHTVLV